MCLLLIVVSCEQTTSTDGHVSAAHPVLLGQIGGCLMPGESAHPFSAKGALWGSCFTCIAGKRAKRSGERIHVPVHASEQDGPRNNAEALGHVMTQPLTLAGPLPSLTMHAA